MTRNEWNNLTPERLDACAASEPRAALEYAADRLTPERLRSTGDAWIGDPITRRAADQCGWCRGVVAQWLIKYHGSDVQEASRASIRAAAEKAKEDGCIYAPRVLRLLDRTEAMA